MKGRKNKIPRHKWYVSEGTGRNKDLPQTKRIFCWIEGRNDKICGAQCLEIGYFFQLVHQGDSREKKAAREEWLLEHLDRWNTDSQTLQ